MLVSRPTPKLEDYLLSVVRDCLFNIFAATLRNWRASPPSSSWGRVIPQWQRTHLTCFENHWPRKIFKPEEHEVNNSGYYSKKNFVIYIGNFSLLGYLFLGGLLRWAGYVIWMKYKKYVTNFGGNMSWKYPHWKQSDRRMTTLWG
jgi:hypothetical protein